MAELSSHDAELLAQDLPELAQIAVASPIYPGQRGQVEYRAAGDARNPAVLMLHGLGSSSAGYRAQFAGLSRDFRSPERARLWRQLTDPRHTGHRVTTPTRWGPFCARPSQRLLFGRQLVGHRGAGLREAISSAGWQPRPSAPMSPGGRVASRGSRCRTGFVASHGGYQRTRLKGRDRGQAADAAHPICGQTTRRAPARCDDDRWLAPGDTVAVHRLHA